MKKLKTIIQYECTTSFKYIWYFYAIQYAVVALSCIIIAIAVGSPEKVGMNCLEINTVIYISILGVLGFKEDFKMLIQNGFTRKYIFLATISMFVFISAIMAFVDTVAGNLLHYFIRDYSSLFGSIYGYNNIFANWLWLFLFYMLICSLFYIGVLVINKIGKISSIYLGVVLGGIALLDVAVFRYVISDEIAQNLMKLAAKAMGFMSNGTINYFFPMVTFLLIMTVLGLGSYMVMRRTELK